MRDKSQERTGGKEDLQGESNKPTAKEKEQIISNVGKLTSDRNVSPKPKPLPLPMFPPPSPNGEVARQLFIGDDSSPKATTSPRKRNAHPNFEAMDLEKDFNSKTTITENK